MHLLATLNRISKLTSFMESARATKTSTPGMVIVDRADYLANQPDYMRLESEAFPDGWKLQITDARGFGDKIREVWPRVLDCPWVSLLNDDHYCLTPNWDIRLINQLNGKNIVSCSDNFNCPPRIGGCTLFSMPLLECLGWPIFPPQINHLGIDDVYELLGRATGCWRLDPDVVVEHRQIMKGAPMDETHLRTYGNVKWEGSAAQIDCSARVTLFIELEFKKAVEKIKAFSGTNKYFERAAAV